MSQLRGPGRGPACTGPAGKAQPRGPRTTSSPTATALPGTIWPEAGRRGWRDLEARLLAVLGRLTERDRLVCRLLDDHRVLTTGQVADVGFSGERRARARLAELYALDVLDRFRPQTWGRPSPYHWVLGPLGAALVAAEAGADWPAPGWRRGLVQDLASSQRLAHLVGVNGFFCGLLRSARNRPGCTLKQWWPERRCAREWGEVVRPDGYGVWAEGGASLAFLLEHDNGTERLGRLGAKLDGYARLAAAAGHPNWVLFSFATARRERDARRALVRPGVPVATASRSAGAAPDAAVWLPVGADGPRASLAQLAEVPLQGA